ncbi:MAG: hypothetical protein JW904_09600 [Spirochaetales bacterium]|nr:hypothetical protein [Spirochaetales bacterium]
MKSITIRGIDDKLHKGLEELSRKEDSSINKTIITLLRKALGLEQDAKYPVYHDLDDLSGTWTEKEYKEFLNATAGFEKIDEEMWR